MATEKEFKDFSSVAEDMQLSAVREVLDALHGIKDFNINSMPNGDALMKILDYVAQKAYEDGRNDGREEILREGD